jgi:hypothetical protein
MLNEINKLFGRDFVIGFFLPSLLFLITSVVNLMSLGIHPIWMRIDPNDALKDTTILAAMSLIVAFFLMSLNRLIFRALEGYWIFDLGKRLNVFQRWRFRRLHGQLDRLKQQKDQCEKEKLTFTKVDEYNRLMERAAQRFPSKESLLLLTSFGNAVRAFEDYPRVMYGFESINGWARLNAVLPKAYRETIGNMRAATDMWVNVWFLSVIVAFECFVPRAAHSLRQGPVWVAMIPMAIGFLAAWQARIAAQQWGEFIKAAFDVFLPALCSKLGYQRPASRESERALWHSLSQAMVYRHSPSLDKLEGLRNLRMCTSGTEPNDGDRDGSE